MSAVFEKTAIGKALMGCIPELLSGKMSDSDFISKHAGSGITYPDTPTFLDQLNLNQAGSSEVNRFFKDDVYPSEYGKGTGRGGIPESFYNYHYI